MQAAKRLAARATHRGARVRERGDNAVQGREVEALQGQHLADEDQLSKRCFQGEDSCYGAHRRKVEKSMGDTWS